MDACWIEVNACWIEVDAYSRLHNGMMDPGETNRSSPLHGGRNGDRISVLFIHLLLVC